MIYEMLLFVGCTLGGLQPFYCIEINIKMHRMLGQKLLLHLGHPLARTMFHLAASMTLYIISMWTFYRIVFHFMALPMMMLASISCCHYSNILIAYNGFLKFDVGVKVWWGKKQRWIRDWWYLGKAELCCGLWWDQHSDEFMDK